jgi:transcriptional regulator GlxA family with amidase domain
MMDRKRVAIVVFDGIEVLDFCGLFEVFSVVRLDEARRREDASPFEVSLVSQSGGPITTTGGMKVVADFAFANCPDVDVLVVPGGWGTRREMHNEAMLSFVRARSDRVGLLASVCTGALILASAGVLDGLRATTHWRSLQMMRELFPSVTVDAESHVVKSGYIVTSAGISAGIDMALRVVADDYGEGVARATARHMEYPYPEGNARRVAL